MLSIEVIESAIMFKENEFLTVSQLNNLIRGVIEMGFPQSLWVCGEIQGYDRNRDRKHVFFELCEKDPDSKDIVARIGLVVFSGRKAAIKEILTASENAFELKDDIEVKFLCKVDFYPPHGAVRLVVESIDPVYTLGKIAQEKQKLIALLKKKGILDKNKQLAFPKVPLKIGLITAHDSAAYNDFISELNLSGYAFKVFYSPALMQGKGVESDVCRAIDGFNKMKGLDVIVITRGGGSIADLSWFDNQRIAEKIAASHLPVLSGIGHEINITVTDLAAYTYQKTPTAIAQFLIERVEGFLTDIEEKVYEIINYAKEQVDSQKKGLRDSALNLQSQTHYFLKSHHQDMIRYLEIIKRQPLKLIATYFSILKEKNILIAKTLKNRLKNSKMKISSYKRIIDIAHPQNTLKRGFSIARNLKGGIIKSVKTVKKGDLLQTQLLDGCLKSQVQKKTGGDDG